MSELKKINYGCGEAKLEGFINIDIEESTKPDLVCDLRTANFPFEKDSISTIHCIHNLEHVEQKYWDKILFEFHRVLSPDGELVLAYPEFEICAKHFIDNYRGMRNFWRWTLYGRQLYPGDFHVVPMRTEEVVQYLQGAGFTNIRYGVEGTEEYNTVVIAEKGEKPMVREELMRKEVFS